MQSCQVQSSLVNSCMKCKHVCIPELYLVQWKGKKSNSTAFGKPHLNSMGFIHIICVQHLEPLQYVIKHRSDLVKWVLFVTGLVVCKVEEALQEHESVAWHGPWELWAHNGWACWPMWCLRCFLTIPVRKCRPRKFFSINDSINMDISGTVDRCSADMSVNMKQFQMSVSVKLYL